LIPCSLEKTSLFMVARFTILLPQCAPHGRIVMLLRLLAAAAAPIGGIALLLEWSSGRRRKFPRLCLAEFQRV
jgi:hypothetical protein